MSDPALNSIGNAMKHWTAAKRTSPPCPVHAGAALAHYEDAQAAINQRMEAIRKVISDESK